MKTTLLACLVGLGLTSGCATPAGQQTPAGAVADAKEAESGLVCDDQPATGSHRPQRVCRKASDVEKERERTQRELQGRNKATGRFKL